MMLTPQFQKGPLSPDDGLFTAPIMGGAGRPPLDVPQQLPAWLQRLVAQSKPQQAPSPVQHAGMNTPWQGMNAVPPGLPAPVSISSHPVMSRPIAAPGPVDHSNDMNPFSGGVGGSLLPHNNMAGLAPSIPQPGAGAPPPPGMGMRTPWPQMNQGPPAAPGAPFPSPGIMGASGQMPNAAAPQGTPAQPPGYAPNGMMQAGNSLMSMLGLGPNAGQPGAGGAGGGTQGPALIQKFMQMLHGGAGQPGMPY